MFARPCNYMVVFAYFSSYSETFLVELLLQLISTVLVLQTLFQVTRKEEDCIRMAGHSKNS